jgi:hypothetical protein
MNALRLRLAFKESVKIHAPLSNVAEKLLAQLVVTEPDASALLVTKAVHM